MVIMWVDREDFDDFTGFLNPITTNFNQMILILMCSKNCEKYELCP